MPSNNACCLCGKTIRGECKTAPANPKFKLHIACYDEFKENMKAPKCEDVIGDDHEG